MMHNLHIHDGAANLQWLKLTSFEGPNFTALKEDNQIISELE